MIIAAEITPAGPLRGAPYGAARSPGGRAKGYVGPGSPNYNLTYYGERRAFSVNHEMLSPISGSSRVAVAFWGRAAIRAFICRVP